MARILLLGGTTEASDLARVFAAAGLDAVFSYAGRTAAGAVLAVLALLLYVPYLPLAKLLEVAVDAFLMEHDPARSPSIVYWGNVLLAIVVWPLLLLKWLVVNTSGDGSGGGRGGGAAAEAAVLAGCGAGKAAEAQRESYELGLVVMLSCGLLALALLWYTLIDPALGEKRSLRLALRRHGRARSAPAPA